MKYVTHLASTFLSLSACVAQPPPVPLLPPPAPCVAGVEEVTTDLTGARCGKLGPDGPFVVYACITADEVDAPHQAREERHAIAIYVRVPVADASVFGKKHPPPPATGIGGLRETSL